MQTSQQHKPGNPITLSAEKLADELNKLSDAVLWKNHRATNEVKDEAQAARLTQRRVALALRRQHAAG